MTSSIAMECVWATACLQLRREVHAQVSMRRDERGAFLFRAVGLRGNERAVPVDQFGVSVSLKMSIVTGLPSFIRNGDRGPCRYSPRS